MQGAVIARAEVNRPNLRWPFPERMAERLAGRRVERLRRRSKYILADLDSGDGANLLASQRMKHHYFIDPVDELGAEVGADDFHHG